MLHLLILNVFLFICLVPKTGVESAMNTGAAIQSAGFQVETHHVTTPDGYILEMYRIPFARFQNAASGTGPRPVVFMQHGMFAASVVYVTMGPEISIGYHLADAGFDVWLGNHRGTKPSRRHTTLNPDDRDDKMQFFDFSWDEVGTIDTPAMIDYVLNYTGREQLHYVGHSQGGTSFLVMASVRTEYNEKIASAHLLAGVGYMNYFPEPTLRALAMFTDTIYAAANLAGLREMFPPDSTEFIGRSSLQPDVSPSGTCFGDVKYSRLCQLIGIPLMVRENEEEEFSNNAIGGGSLKQLAHYGQNIRDRAFRRWSYGFFQNMAQYGSTAPPLYDLSLITINTTMHYSLNDTLLDEQDVLDMAAVMPNTVARKVARDSFDHMDFVYALDAKALVTDNVIESILYVETTLLDSEEQNIEGEIVEEVAVEVDQIDSGLTGSAHSVLNRSGLVLVLVLIGSFL